MILDGSSIQLGIQLYYSSSFPLPYHTPGLFGGRFGKRELAGELNIGEAFVVLGWGGGWGFCSFCLFSAEQTLQQQLASSTVMTLILLGDVRLYEQQKCFLHCVSFNITL